MTVAFTAFYFSFTNMSQMSARLTAFVFFRNPKKDIQGKTFFLKMYHCLQQNYSSFGQRQQIYFGLTFPVEYPLDRWLLSMLCKRICVDSNLAFDGLCNNKLQLRSQNISWFDPLIHTQHRRSSLFKKDSRHSLQLASSIRRNCSQKLHLQQGVSEQRASFKMPSLHVIFSLKNKKS